MKIDKTTSVQTESVSRGWLIWTFAALFYSYEFFLRISPNVMINDLMQAYHVTAVHVGSISAFYYYAYALMQLPVGLVIDRFGVRRPLFFAALLVSIGCLLFSMTNSVMLACLGRLFMGVGSAFAFVGCLKIGVAWLPKEKFSIVVGLTNMLGVLGAISGEAPLAAVVIGIGWRQSMLLASLLGLILAVAMWFFIRDHSSEKQLPDSNTHLKQGLMVILKSSQTWLNALFAGLMVAPIATFAELWGVPFLQLDLQVSKPQAAALESLVFLGIACGGPFIGWLSGVTHRRLTWLFIGSLIAMTVLSCIIYVPMTNVLVTSVLLFLFGFASSSMLLSFALNTEMNPPRYSGFTIAFTNMIIMGGGAAFQPLAGWLLDLQGQVIFQHGTAVFSLPAYHKALIILPICHVLAFFVLFFIRDSHCKQCVS